MSKHTPGPWTRQHGITVVSPFQKTPSGKRSLTICRTDNDHMGELEQGANARLIASAPDRRDQLLALIKYGWTVEHRSFYDEEGIEGWAWIEPGGAEHTEVGDWSELPPWPDSARAAIAEAEGDA